MLQNVTNHVNIIVLIKSCRDFHHEVTGDNKFGFICQGGAYLECYQSVKNGSILWLSLNHVMNSFFSVHGSMMLTLPMTSIQYFCNFVP